MNLYVNGDSHSYGINLEHTDKFATLVAKQFDLSVENHAHIGASNTRIIRTTREYLAQGNTPSLIIIGWTTWEREEWLHNGTYYNVNSSGHDALPDALADQYKEWVVEQTQTVLETKSQHWHNEIYQLHSELVQQHIPHVFFNCMYNFFNCDSRKEWNNNYVGPYDNELSFYWYLHRQGFKTDAWYHYSADGNRAWAEFLINFIRKNQLL
jgi:hypothetical protein